MATGGFQVHDRMSNKLVCDLCNTKVDTCLCKCVNCNIYICNICTRAHNRLQLTRDHKVLKDQHGPLPPSRADSRCTSHPGEDVIFYCYTCMIFICSLCITSNHSNHKCSMIKQASEEMSAELKYQLNNLKDNHITALRSDVKQLENLQTCNQVRHKSNVKNIHAQTDAMVKEINKIQTKRIQESEKTTNQNKSRLSELQDNVVKKAEELESKYSDYNKVLISGSDIDKIIARNEVFELLRTHQGHTQQVKIHNLKFVSGEIDMTSIEKSFGLIEVLEGDSSAEYRSKSTSKTASDTVTSSGAFTNSITPFKHKSTNVQSICPISDATSYVRCGTEYSIDRVDKSGQLQGSTKLDIKVCDFVVTPQCDFICSVYNSINICKVSKEGQITQMLYKGPLTPYCLCLSSYGHILVTMYEKLSYDVNEKSQRLVTKMTVTGLILATHEYDNDKRLFTIPTGIDENTNKDICVINKTSYNNGHLVILDASGRLKCTYKGQGSKTFDPVRVKCDKFGHIFLSDWINKKIHVLNRDGQLIKHLMTDKHLHYNPFSLAIGTNNLLWVGCNHGWVYIVKYIED